MTNEYFQAPNSFEKVKHWPRFARYLDENYTEVVERRFPREYGTWARGEDDVRDPNAYRIYILNSSPLAQDAAARLAAQR